jgi:hypothetical protein
MSDTAPNASQTDSNAPQTDPNAAVPSVTAPDPNASETDPNAGVQALLQQQGHSMEELNKWLPLDVGEIISFKRIQKIVDEESQKIADQREGIRVLAERRRELSSRLIKLMTPNQDVVPGATDAERQELEKQRARLQAEIENRESTVETLATMDASLDEFAKAIEKLRSDVAPRITKRRDLNSRLSKLMTPNQDVVPGARDAERQELEKERARLQAEIENRESTMATLATVDASLDKFEKDIEKLRSDVAPRIIKRHNNAIEKLKSEFDFISEIPKQGDPGSPDRALWQTYNAALTNIRARDPARDVADAPSLSEFRENYRTAAQDLINAYERNAPPLDKTGAPLADNADYWKKQQDSIGKLNSPTFYRARNIEALTSEAKQKKKAFDAADDKMIADYRATDPTIKLTAKGLIARLKDVTRLAEEAIDAQSNAPPNETAYYKRLKEVEEDIEFAAAKDGTIRTKYEQLTTTATDATADFSRLKTDLENLHKSAKKSSMTNFRKSKTLSEKPHATF